MIQESREDKLARRAATKDNSRKKRAKDKTGGKSTSVRKAKVAPGRKKTHFGPVMPKKMQLLLKSREEAYRRFKYFSENIGLRFAFDRWLIEASGIVEAYPDGFPKTADAMLEAIEYETALLRSHLEESA